MKCWLIVNQFLHSKKFNEIYKWLEKALRKYDFETVLMTNSALINDGIDFIDSSLELPDAVVFWDKDIRLAEFLEQKGTFIFNNSKAIAIADDKSLTYQAMLKNHIPTPKTIIAPMTYRNIGYTDTDFIDKAAEALYYPMVIKECFGSFGAQVHLAHNAEEAYMICKATSEPLILQQYIAESHGRDIRLNMVGGECAAAMERYNNKDFRANITAGGSMRPYTPTAEEIALARRACEAIELDFGGVDILHTHNGPVICEINSNAHFKNIFECTGINVAENIAEYICSSIEEYI